MNPRGPANPGVENGDRKQGFTLLEIVVVILIMGILASVVGPALSGVSPKYRLRAAARDVGSNINHVRSLASATGKLFVLHYDLETQKYWMVHPPEPDEDPDMDIADRQQGTVNSMPIGVTIDEIFLPDGSSETGGELDLRIDPLGNEGSHILVLKNNDDQIITIKFNALLGFVDYFSEVVEFEKHR